MFLFLAYAIGLTTHELENFIEFQDSVLPKQKNWNFQEVYSL